MKKTNLAVTDKVREQQKEKQEDKTWGWIAMIANNEGNVYTCPKCGRQYTVPACEIHDFSAVLCNCERVQELNEQQRIRPVKF